LASTLLTSSVWADLDQDIVARTLQRFEALTVPAGHVLIEQGKETPGLFVILGGNVDVVAAAEIDHVRLKQLGAGDVCGEMGLMSGKAASARCVTTSPTRAAVLSQAALHELATALPALAERLAALASARAAFNEHFLPADIARVGAL
jgi:CRP-like cAMP-binding protein